MIPIPFLGPVSWLKLAGPIAALLAIAGLTFALHVTRATLASREHDLTVAHSSVQSLEDANASEHRTVLSLLAQIDDSNKTLLAAAARYQADQAKAAADRAALAERAKSADRTIADLQASARAGGPRCEPSAAALKALEGL